MKLKYFVISYVVVALLGVLFHFAYDILDFPFLKVIFPTNESIFEHTKLIVFPALLFTVFDILYSNEEKALQINIFALLVALIFLIMAYYTYSGIIGKNIDFINIALFFISFIIYFYIRYKKITPFDKTNSVIILIIIILLIEIFTFKPLDIPFFEVISHLPRFH